MLKAELERRNLWLETEVTNLRAQVAAKEKELKALGVNVQHTTALAIACERTSDAMAHIISDYTKLKMSNKPDSVNG